MKNKINKTKVKGVGEIETPETNPLLIHFLSPLELVAYKHKFKKFNYNLGGIVIEIEPHMSRILFYRSKKHVTDMRDILQSARLKSLKQSDEQVRRFLLKPLKNHQLPTRIYHILASNYCRKMEDVAEKGAHGLIRMRGMGKDSVSYLMNLFIKNGCGSLFV